MTMSAVAGSPVVRRAGGFVGYEYVQALVHCCAASHPGRAPPAPLGRGQSDPRWSFDLRYGLPHLRQQVHDPGRGVVVGMDHNGVPADRDRPLPRRLHTGSGCGNVGLPRRNEHTIMPWFVHFTRPRHGEDRILFRYPSCCCGWHDRDGARNWLLHEGYACKIDRMGDKTDSEARLAVVEEWLASLRQGLVVGDLTWEAVASDLRLLAVNYIIRRQLEALEATVVLAKSGFGHLAGGSSGPPSTSCYGSTGSKTSRRPQRTSYSSTWVDTTRCAHWLPSVTL